MQILIAEDDPVSRKILETSLKKWGYDVIVATDGFQALEAVEKNTASFAILDWMMPGVDGIEVCRKIRTNSNDRYTYIILLTAKGTKEDVIVGLDAGADDYMMKPFDAGELKSRLRVGERILGLQENLAMQLRQMSKANERMRDDLAAASRIQKSMLPMELPQCDEVSFDFKVIPCEAVGGDMVNIFKMDENNIGVWVFDVVGHGVAAAMYAVLLSRFLSPSNNGSSMVKKIKSEEPFYEVVSPSVVAEQLNNQFCLDNQEKNSIYSTMIYGVLNIRTLKFSFINAGHPSPILINGKECGQLPSKGALPIGVMPDTVFPLNEVWLNKGNRLVFYTDGAFQAMNELEVPFGMKRLMALLASQAHLTLEESLRNVIDTVMDWGKPSEKQDDITILGIDIK